MFTRDGHDDRRYVLDSVLDGTRALTQLEWLAGQGQWERVAERRHLASSRFPPFGLAVRARGR